MQIQNSLYHQLQKLIWAAFVGVISFQLIVPQIWGYMNKLAGISYSTGYFLFITGYAALVPCLAIVWLLKNYGDIKKLLFPVGEPETTGLCTLYLYGVIGNCALQFVVFLSTLFLSYWTPIPYTAFKIIQILSLISSGALIALGSFIAKRRIDIEISSSRSSKRNELSLKYSLKVTIGACVTFFLAVTLWDALYLSDKCKEHYIPNNYFGDTGFKLLETKDTIAKYKAKIDDNSLQLLPAANQDSLNFQLKKDSLRALIMKNWQRSDPKRKLSQAQIIADKKKQDAIIKAWIDADILSGQKNDSFAVKNSKKIDSLSKEKKKHELRDAALIQWLRLDVIARSVKKIDSCDLKFVQGHAIGSDQAIVKVPAADKAEFITLSKNYLQVLEDKTKDTAQKILGKVMRDHQSKILFSLLNIFFALLALYMFLRMNSQIHSSALKGILAKNRSTSVRDDNGDLIIRGDKTYTERELASLEKAQAGSAELTEGAWFIIVITIWMLLPMFKPMADKDIDTESPYKHFTLSPTIEKAAGIDNSSKTTTTYTNSFNQQIGTLNHTIYTDTSRSSKPVDLGELMEKVAQIDSVVKAVDNKAQQISTEAKDLKKQVKNIEKKTDHIEP